MLGDDNVTWPERTYNTTPATFLVKDVQKSLVFPLNHKN